MADNIEIADPMDTLLDMPVPAHERLRIIALMLAVKYHTDTVIKDGALYTAIKMDGQTITPVNDDRIIELAMKFEDYFRQPSPAPELAPSQGDDHE